jgi:hypothetical protein
MSDPADYRGRLLQQYFVRGAFSAIQQLAPGIDPGISRTQFIKMLYAVGVLPDILRT